MSQSVKTADRARRPLSAGAVWTAALSSLESSATLTGATMASGARARVGQVAGVGANARALLKAGRPVEIMELALALRPEGSGASDELSERDLSLTLARSSHLTLACLLHALLWCQETIKDPSEEATAYFLDAGFCWLRLSDTRSFVIDKLRAPGEAPLALAPEERQHLSLSLGLALRQIAAEWKMDWSSDRLLGDGVERALAQECAREIEASVSPSRAAPKRSGI